MYCRLTLSIPGSADISGKLFSDLSKKIVKRICLAWISLLFVYIVRWQEVASREYFDKWITIWIITSCFVINKIKGNQLSIWFNYWAALFVWIGQDELVDTVLRYRYLQEPTPAAVFQASQCFYSIGFFTKQYTSLYSLLDEICKSALVEMEAVEPVT